MIPAITLETMTEANEKVDRQKRYAQIIACLAERPDQTAKEVAEMMKAKGEIPTSERNFTAPRLTELMHNGRVAVIGKKLDPQTKVSVAVYRLLAD